MVPRRVLVIGATGAVGSAVARTAHSHGAQVFLALRDISKVIPGLTATEEQNSRYERVQADLTQPESVRAVVSNTGATHAFIYAALGASPDHMLSSAEALKAAGIERVVLLSSITVHGDLRAIPPTDFIGYEHARVELSLESVFGPQGFVAVRPSYFAKDGKVKWAFPDLKHDFISPDDIGAVSRVPVLLIGPETDLSVVGAIGIIGETINKPVRVTKISPDENIQVMVEKAGVPEPVTKTLTESFAKTNEDQSPINTPLTSEARANIEKYLKRPPVRFLQWVERNEDKCRG
ncbi:hypothetical protein BDW62DRAFT_219327 [Aspergillus aurantiobrunneus]